MNRDEVNLSTLAAQIRGDEEDAYNRRPGQLAEALSGFTGEIKDAHKNASGHNYKYADLPTILQLVRPLLAKYGLSVMQFPVSSGEQVGVRTILMHKSGESIEDRFMMTVSSLRGMSDAQAIGTTITYFRRYALAAVLGISQEDDDGKSAQPKPPTVAQCIDSISKAQTISQLKTAFANAYEYHSDNEKITAAKDKRKEELSK